jgi:putative colanic acid biosynthesis UDP-glucose lipid carrier transferase
MFLVMPLVVPAWFARFGLYRPRRGESVWPELGRLLLALCTLYGAFALLALFTKSGASYSRVWVGSSFLLSVGFMLTSRLLVRSVLAWLRRTGRNRRYLVLVGTASGMASVKAGVERSLESGFELVAEFDVDSMNEAELADSLNQLLSTADVDQVWIARPAQDFEKVRDLQRSLETFSTQVYWVPDFIGVELVQKSMRIVAGMPVLHMQKNPLVGHRAVAKAAEDRLLALMLVLALLPLGLLIALAVKLDSPGPAIFKQVRHGWNGRSIKVYKFRTMVEHKERDGVIEAATRGDMRVTKVGRFLRNTSLDELPQFLNVLQGRMSIVGPRPHPISQRQQFEAVAPNWSYRYKVKPGVTGWAQVNGYRGEIDTDEKLKKRIEYDLYYIEHWSLWLDFKIILKTAFRAWNQTNAY